MLALLLGVIFLTALLLAVVAIDGYFAAVLRERNRQNWDVLVTMKDERGGRRVADVQVVAGR